MTMWNWCVFGVCVGGALANVLLSQLSSVTPPSAVGDIDLHHQSAAALFFCPSDGGSLSYLGEAVM